MSRTIKRILAGLIVIISLMFLVIGVRLVQVAKTEKNFPDIIKCIAKIELEKRDVVELNQYSYITKSDIRHIKLFLNKSGWEFKEQLGAGYLFKNSNGERLLLISRHVFGKRYFILENADKKQ